MISLHPAVLFILLELLLISVGICVFLFFWARRRRQPANAESAAPATQQNPDAGQYLFTEEKLTRSRLAVITSTTNLDDHDETTSAALALRADYLKMEHDLVKVEERDEAFWKSFDDAARALVEKHTNQEKPARAETALELAPNIARRDADAAQLKALVDTQVHAIKDLQHRLSDAIGDDLKRQELDEYVDRLARTNHEMTSCISILENENEFLRKQIAESAKADRSSEN